MAVSPVNTKTNSSLLDPVVFAVGVYAGIFIDQRYQVPKADDPQALWQKIQDYVEKYKKDK